MTWISRRAPRRTWASRRPAWTGSTTAWWGPATSGYDRYDAGYDTGYERGYGGGGGRAYRNAAYDDASYGAGAGRGWRATAAQTSYEPAVGGTYVVQSGDTLYDIALDLGTTVDALAAANGIADPDVLYVGQTLSY